MNTTRRTFIAVSALAVPAIVKAAAPAKIKIGQIGTHHPHASGKMAAIRSLSDTYEVVGLAELEGLTPRKHPAYAGLPTMSVDKLLATPGLQAVAIETGVHDLVPTGIRALKAGHHLHLDKPGGESLKDFKELLDLSVEKNRTVQMGYMLRYNPAFVFMFHACREGWLGDIMEIDAMMGKMASPGLRKELGVFKGGGMFELAGHIIDAAVTVLGKPERVAAFAKKTQADDFSDNQLAVLDYPKATATIRCNHRDPFGFPRRRFQVAGDQGSIEIFPLESGKFTLHLSKAQGAYKKGTQQLSLKREGGRYDGEFKDLAAVIRGEKKLAWTPEHDLAMHETLLRASGI